MKDGHPPLAAGMGGDGSSIANHPADHSSVANDSSENNNNNNNNDDNLTVHNCPILTVEDRKELRIQAATAKKSLVEGQLQTKKAVAAYNKLWKLPQDIRALNAIDGKAKSSLAKFTAREMQIRSDEWLLEPKPKRDKADNDDDTPRVRVLAISAKERSKLKSNMKTMLWNPPPIRRPYHTIRLRYLYKLLEHERADIQHQKDKFSPWDLQPARYKLANPSEGYDEHESEREWDALWDDCKNNSSALPSIMAPQLTHQPPIEEEEDDDEVPGTANEDINPSIADTNEDSNPSIADTNEDINPSIADANEDINPSIADTLFAWMSPSNPRPTHWRWLAPRSMRLRAPPSTRLPARPNVTHSFARDIGSGRNITPLPPIPQLQTVNHAYNSIVERARKKSIVRVKDPACLASVNTQIRKNAHLYAQPMEHKQYPRRELTLPTDSNRLKGLLGSLRACEAAQNDPVQAVDLANQIWAMPTPPRRLPRQQPGRPQEQRRAQRLPLPWVVPPERAAHRPPPWNEVERHHRWFVEHQSYRFLGRRQMPLPDGAPTIACMYRLARLTSKFPVQRRYPRENPERLLECQPRHPASFWRMLLGAIVIVIAFIAFSSLVFSYKEGQAKLLAYNEAPSVGFAYNAGQAERFTYNDGPAEYFAYHDGPAEYYDDEPRDVVGAQTLQFVLNVDAIMAQRGMDMRNVSVESIVVKDVFALAMVSDAFDDMQSTHPLEFNWYRCFWAFIVMTILILMVIWCYLRAGPDDESNAIASTNLPPPPPPPPQPSLDKEEDEEDDVIDPQAGVHNGDATNLPPQPPPQQPTRGEEKDDDDKEDTAQVGANDGIIPHSCVAPTAVPPASNADKQEGALNALQLPQPMDGQRPGKGTSEAEKPHTMSPAAKKRAAASLKKPRSSAKKTEELAGASLKTTELANATVESDEGEEAPQFMPNKRQKLDALNGHKEDSQPRLGRDDSDLDFGDGWQDGDDDDHNDDESIGINQNNGKRHRNDEEDSKESRKEARLNTEDDRLVGEQQGDMNAAELDEVEMNAGGLDEVGMNAAVMNAEAVGMNGAQDDGQEAQLAQGGKNAGGLDEVEMHAAGMNAQAVQEDAQEAPVAQEQAGQEIVAHRIPYIGYHYIRSCLVTFSNIPNNSELPFTLWTHWSTQSSPSKPTNQIKHIETGLTGL